VREFQSPEAVEERRPEPPAPETLALDRRQLTPDAILALQGSAGNAATMAAIGGKKPDRRPDEAVGGRTAGEFLGDMWRPVGTALGDVVGSVAGALGGGSVSTRDLVKPAWTPGGEFDWGIAFDTSGRNGWIVQEVTNTYRIQDATGGAIPTPATPHYWEAWEVDAAGTVTPADHRGNDDWQRPNMDTSSGGNTKGHWSMEGVVYWTDTDPATQGFASGNVADAGILLSTTTQPKGLGVPRDFRYAQGNWDSTAAKPYHDGSAA